MISLRNLPGTIKDAAVSNAPTLLLAGGIAGVVGGAFMACRAAYRARDIFEEHGQAMDELAESEMDEDDPEYVATYRAVTMRTAVETAREFAPGVLMMGAGIAAIIFGHRVESRRMAMATLALNSALASYHELRSKVSERLGEDELAKLEHGTEKVEVEEVKVGKDGRERKRKRSIEVVLPDDGRSAIDRLWDGTTTYATFSHSKDQNSAFLMSQQQYFNDRLHSRGYVYLSEVYDALGFDSSKHPEVQVLGWVDDEHQQGFVDFGLFRSCNDEARDMMKREDSWFLHFNVDGIIIDKVAKITRRLGF